MVSQPATGPRSPLPPGGSARVLWPGSDRRHPVPYRSGVRMCRNPSLSNAASGPVAATSCRRRPRRRRRRPRRRRTRRRSPRRRSTTERWPPTWSTTAAAGPRRRTTARRSRARRRRRHRPLPAVDLAHGHRPGRVLPQDPRLAASSAWYASDSARNRRNDSTRSQAAEPAGVRTRSSQARSAAASPAPATRRRPPPGSARRARSWPASRPPAPSAPDDADDAQHPGRHLAGAARRIPSRWCRATPGAGPGGAAARAKFES